MVFDWAAAISAVSNLTKTIIEKAVPDSVEAKARLVLKLKKAATEFSVAARKRSEERERKLTNGK